MSTSEFDAVIEQYHIGVDAFVKGDPELQKPIWSRRDDITLANPVGPPARGWKQVEAAMDGAAAQVRDGEPCRYELISSYVTPELAYVLEIQSTTARLGDASERSPISLRVTTVFRREGGDWKVVHRHADPITQARPISSVVQQGP